MTDVSSSGDATVRRQADFYAKLSNLERDVVAGVHPRYNFEKGGIANPRPVNGIAVAAAARSLNDQRNAQQRDGPSTTFDGSSDLPPPNPLGSTHALPQKPPVSASTFTQYVSPFGAKPHLRARDLQSAEMALKRHRLEKSLKEDVEASKTQRRPNDASAWDGPRVFDVSQILSAVQNSDKSNADANISSAANDNRSSNGSFDENEYYSSKGNSWSPEEAAKEPSDLHIKDTATQATTQAATADTLLQGVTSKTNSTTRPTAAVNVQAAAVATGLEGSLSKSVRPTQHVAPASLAPNTYSKSIQAPSRQASSTQASSIQAPSIQAPSVQAPSIQVPSTQAPSTQALSTQASNPSSQGQVQRNGYTAAPNSMSRPSAPGAKSNGSNGVSATGRPAAPPIDPKPPNKLQLKRDKASKTHSSPMKPSGVQIDLPQRESESYSPPSPAVPVVRNNIAAPAAPQPSRVSPLTYGRIPGFVQQASVPQPKPVVGAPQATPSSEQRKQPAKQNKRNNAASRRQEATRTTNKRRRMPDDNEPLQNNKPAKRVAQAPASPEPYIKQEPASPPPVASTQSNSKEAPRRLVFRDDGRADIEVLSPHVNGHPPSNRVANTHRQPIVVEDDVPSPRSAQLPRSGRMDEDPRTLAVARRRPQETTDLRRVASAQYANRAYSPSRSYYADSSFIDDGQYLRRPARVLSDQLALPRYQIYDDNVARPVSSLQTRDRLQFYEQYPPTYVAPRADMPPPPPKRRIIIDENGEEWIAVQASSSLRRPYVREPVYYDQPLQHDTAIRDTVQPDHFGRPLQRAPSYQDEQIRSHVDTLDRPIRAQSQMLEPSSSQLAYRLPPRQVIELEDDGQYGRLDPRPMPPPASRYARYETQMHDHPTPAALQPRSQSHLPSHELQFIEHNMQQEPMRQAQRSRIPQNVVPPAPNDQPYYIQQRSASARPELSQATGAYGHNSEYDPRYPTIQRW